MSYQVFTYDGIKKIEDVTSFDLIYSYNIGNAEEVIRTIDIPLEQSYLISFSNDKYAHYRGSELLEYYNASKDCLDRTPVEEIFEMTKKYTDDCLGNFIILPNHIINFRSLDSMDFYTAGASSTTMSTTTDRFTMSINSGYALEYVCNKQRIEIDKSISTFHAYFKYPIVDSPVKFKDIFPDIEVFSEFDDSLAFNLSTLFRRCTYTDELNRMEFLRGAMDVEGMYLDDNSVVLQNKDKEILKQVQIIFGTMGIETMFISVYNDYSRLKILVDNQQLMSLFYDFTKKRKATLLFNRYHNTNKHFTKVVSIRKSDIEITKSLQILRPGKSIIDGNFLPRVI